MPKCERCGLEGDSLELKVCPDKITKWAKTPICKQCYLELKKIEENRILKDKSTYNESSEKVFTNGFRKNKYKKPMIIYILVILWIIIGFLFIGAVFSKYSEYSNYIDLIGRSSYGIANSLTFTYFAFIFLFIIVVIISFILAIFTFIKKNQSWLVGLMFSSFLLYFGFQAVHFIGWIGISGEFNQIFRSFEYVTYTCVLIIVPFIILILTRPNVKAYFGKV